MSKILNKNKNRVAKFLTDSKFGLHSYEDLLETTIEVTLSKDAWEEQSQTIKNTAFFEKGYKYTIAPKTMADNLQWTGAEISASSVSTGEMEFTYAGYAPTSDITLLITMTGTKESEDEEDDSPSAIVYSSTATIGGSVPDQDYVNMEPEITYSEVLQQIESGYIPFFIGQVHYENNYGTEYTDRIFQGFIGISKTPFDGEVRDYIDITLNSDFDSASIPLSKEESDWGIPNSYPHTWEYTEGE